MAEVWSTADPGTAGSRGGNHIIPYPLGPCSKLHMENNETMSTNFIKLIKVNSKTKSYIELLAI